MRITTKKNLSALWSPLQSENKTLSEKREHVNVIKLFKLRLKIFKSVFYI